MKAKLYSVVTGDIVHSSSLTITNKKKLKKIFGDLSQNLKANFPGLVLYDIDVYRGDGWQLLVNNPKSSLRLALIIRALLKSGFYKVAMDSRISIGIGTVESISKTRISQSIGEAFTLSGTKLDSLTKMKMGFNIGDENLRNYFDLLFAFIDRIFHGLTEKQSYAVYGALMGWNQTTIAENWIDKKIAQSAVAQHLETASWHVLTRAIDFYETEMDKL